MHACCSVGLPSWLSNKRIHLQCRRDRLYPWVKKIPWRRKRLSTPVFLPGKPMDREAWQAESDTTVRPRRMHHCFVMPRVWETQLQVPRQDTPWYLSSPRLLGNTSGSQIPTGKEAWKSISIRGGCSPHRVEESMLSENC